MVRFFLFCVLCFVPSFAFADGWSEGRPMGTSRAALAVTQMDGKIYAIGGAGRLAPMSVAERYDPKNGGWRSIPDLPVGLEQFGLAAVGGKIYAAGGYAADGDGMPSAEVWWLDEATDEWRAAPALPSPRAAFSLVAGQGKLFAIGGAGKNTDQIFVFEPELNAWRVLPGAPTARRGATAVHIGAKLYIVAGGAQSAPSARLDIYDIKTNVWSQGPDLPLARSGHAMAVFAGKIHVMGGRSGGRGATLNDHWVYAPNSQKWSRGHDLSIPRTGAGAAAVGASLYLIGGGSGGGFYASFTSMNSVEVLRLLPKF